MRLCVNLFLALFCADGAVSLIDELAALLFPLSVLSQFRNFLAEVVIVMSIALYLSLGIDKRLPKRVFLPLVLFVWWGPMSSWIFPSLSGNATYGVLAAAGQLSLCLLPVTSFSKRNQRSLLMPRAMFGAPYFSLRNTLTFAAANVFIAPFALALLLLWSANSFMETNTSGFMRVAPDGVHMAERVYRRADKTIQLAAMIHVGEKEYYEALVKSVVPGRTIVLAEGVSDDQNLLRDKPDYGKVAGYFGLTAQQEKMHIPGRLIKTAELGKPHSRSLATGASSAPEVDILRADVDVSSFHQPTIEFLNTLGKQMKGSGPLARNLLASEELSRYFTPEMQQVIMDDILSRRNKEVISQLRKSIGFYDTVVIPWGALHMVEIEAEVLKQGFELQQVRERVSIDFIRILRGK